MTSAAIKEKFHCFSNQENADFYEHLPPSEFRENALAGGLDYGCDLELLKSYINQSSSILEIGAGYGRVIGYLKKHHYQGKLVAIERSRQLCDFICASYSDYVRVINDDVMTCVLNESFDLVLWLWSGISDFSQVEQLTVLKKISTLLSTNGVLVLDTLAVDVCPRNLKAVISLKDQVYSIKRSNYILSGYTPSPEEVRLYAKKIGLASCRYIPYKTSADRNRSLYILSR